MTQLVQFCAAWLGTFLSSICIFFCSEMMVMMMMLILYVTRRHCVVSLHCPLLYLLTKGGEIFSKRVVRESKRKGSFWEGIKVAFWGHERPTDRPRLHARSWGMRLSINFLDVDIAPTDCRLFCNEVVGTVFPGG